MANLVQVDAQAFEHPTAMPSPWREPRRRCSVPMWLWPGDGPRRWPLGDALSRGVDRLRRRRAIAAADDEFHGLTDFGELDVHVLEHARGYTFALTVEAEQQMLGAE